MKLFKIEWAKGKIEYFGSKAEAKGALAYAGLSGMIPIHRGPDHWKGESDGTVRNLPPSQPRSGKKRKRNNK